MVAVAALSLFRVENFDLWLHLKGAELNLHSRSVAKVDPFSAFARGKPWVNHSWLSCVALYAVHAAAGVPGLVIVRALMAMAIVALWVTTAVRDGARLDRAVAASVLGYGCMRDWLLVRPVLFTFLFASVFALVLVEFRRGRRWVIWTLPVLGMLWANMHAGATTGWILIAAAMLDAGIKWLRQRSREALHALVHLSVCLAATFALAFVNPYGADGALYALKISRAKVFMGNIQEWLPAWTGDYPIYWIALGVGVSLLVATWRSVRFSEAFLFVLFGLLSLRTRRYIGMFGAICAPILARQAEAWLNARRHSARRHPRARLAAALLLACGGTWWAVADGTHPLGLALRQNWYPRKAVDFLRRAQVRGPVFNEYRWGGYLIWRAWPDVQVMMDGRNLVYGEELYREWRVVAAGDPGWGDVLDRRHVRFMLIDYARPASFYAADEWRLVYWDDAAMVRARMCAENQALIRKHDCTSSNPETLMDRLRSLDVAKDLAVQLREKIAADPECVTARENLARCLVRLGRHADAIRQLNIVLAAEPRRSSALALRGFCRYATGMFRTAMRDYRRAVRSGPHESLHHHSLGDCYRKLGRWRAAERAYRTAAKLNPAFPTTHLRLADVCLKVGKASDALAEARHYVRLRPDDPNAKVLLERCLGAGSE